MSELIIEGLCASVGDQEILTGVDLTVRSGEVHAIMGPNGSGKSTLAGVLMGRPAYTVTGGSVTLDGMDILSLPTYERAAAGLFLGMQYPTEVPGVDMASMLTESFRAAGRDVAEVLPALIAESERVGLDESFLSRSMNVDFSGGEKKRNETMQLAVLAPKFAILDEIDSGLDVDALTQVSRRIEDATNELGMGVIAVTHYNRLLEVLNADFVHIFARGRILESGGPEVGARLEETGYGAWVDDDPSADGPADKDGIPADLGT